MAPENAIRSIGYVCAERELWISFQHEQDAEIFAKKGSGWVLRDNTCVYRTLPDSVLCHFTTDAVFGLEFQNPDSAAQWSSTSHEELWQSPTQQYGTGALGHQRCIKLYCDRTRLRKALGEKLGKSGAREKVSKPTTNRTRDIIQKTKHGVENAKSLLSKHSADAKCSD